MKRRLRIAALLILVFALLVFAGIIWLLKSGGGRDFALSTVADQLPPGALTWEGAEGSLWGPLSVRHLRYQADGLTLEIDALTLDHAAVPLLSQRLEIRSLAAERVRLDLPPAPLDPQPAPLVFPASLPWPQLSLPLAIDISSLSVDEFLLTQSGDALARPTSLQLGASISQKGDVTLRALRLENSEGVVTAAGDVELAGAPRAKLDASWQFRDEKSPALTLQIAGDGEQLGLAGKIDGNPFSVNIDRQLDWRLAVEAEALDLSRWLPSAAPKPASEPEVRPGAGAKSAPATESLLLGLDWRASGSRGSAEASGEVRIAGRLLEVSDLRVALSDAGDAIDFAAIEAALDDGGQLSASGRLLLGETPRLDARGRLTNIVLEPGQAGVKASTLSADMVAVGPLDALALSLSDGRVQRGEESAAVEAELVIGQGSAEIVQLTLAKEGSTLSASGQVGWEPSLLADLELQLRGFDPSLVLADYPGDIDGDISLHYEVADDRPALSVRIDSLDGTLRGRALSGSGELEWVEGRTTADIKLSLGESRIRVTGDPGDSLDLRLQLQPLQLGDLLAGASGRVEADFALSGDRQTPRLVGELTAESLALPNLQVERLTAKVDGSLAPSGEMNIRLDASKVSVADNVIDTLTVDLSGSRERHRLELAANAESANLQLRASGGVVGDPPQGWRGSLGKFELRVPEYGALKLDQPAEIDWSSSQGFAISRTCLQSAEAGDVCLSAEAEAGVQRLTAELLSFDLAAIGAALNPAGLQIDGKVQGKIDVTRSAERVLSADVRIRLASGALVRSELADRPLLSWSDIELVGMVDEQQANFTLDGKLDEGGSIKGELSGPAPGADGRGALNGSLTARLNELSALEIIVPEFAAPKGRLQADLSIAGSWGAPALQGSIELQSFGAELPQLGITLQDSELVLRSDGRRFEVEGLINSGDGVLRMEGSLDDALEENRSARLTIRGTKVLVSNTQTARVLVTPDLLLRMNDGRLRVTGSVLVPEAALALDQLDNTVRPSNDVVVIEAGGLVEESSTLPLRATIDVELGDKVTLQGFGFDGGVSGKLQITERSGRATTGRGALTVRGRYEAYGQDLEIIRGRLLFASSPLDDPGLDVRAQRKVDNYKVGIEVSGTAQQPYLTVWSQPAADQAEALSLLILGRPLRSASSAEGAQLGQAAAALGGNLLAGKIGGRLGFDTFGVANSKALGGAAFTVGKFLSPALYLSYGVSLFGTGQVVTLKYLLSERFDVEIESGTESRAGLNYRIER